MSKSEFDPYYYEIAIKLALGEISKEEYEEKRDVTSRAKWKEVKELAIKEPSLFLMYIKNLRFNYRVKAIKEIHSITSDIVKKMWKNSIDHRNITGGVDIFFSGKYSVDVGLSMYLFDLSIILDTPVEYFLTDNIFGTNPDSFTEYSFADKTKSIHDIINFTIERPENRIIAGFQIVPKSFLFEKSEFIRVDKRLEFFIFEIYVTDRKVIDKNFVTSIEKKFNGSIRYVFLSNPLLRNSYKICFLGSYEDSISDLQKLQEFIVDFKRCKLNEQILLTYEYKNAIQTSDDKF